MHVITIFAKISIMWQVSLSMLKHCTTTFERVSNMLLAYRFWRIIYLLYKNKCIIACSNFT